MKKETIAKIVIFLLTTLATALGVEGLDPEISVYIDSAIGVVAGIASTLIANWLHHQPVSGGSFR
jgi:hypothetical protein